MTHQPFICSYPKDYPWLEHLLWSLDRFGSQLSAPVVCVATHHAASALDVIAAARSKATIVIKDGPVDRGMMRSMVAMMSADLLCPQADYLWLFGSDCFLTDHIAPNDFVREDGRPVLLFTPYTKFLGLYPGGLKWQAGCEKIMRLRPDHEFMRRLPCVYTRSVLSATRRYIEGLHGDFDRFCFNYRDDDFSEANLIGTWAWFNAPNEFAWQLSEFNPCLQFWSHGGLDRPCDGDVMYFGGNARTKTPRQIIEETRRKSP